MCNASPSPLVGEFLSVALLALIPQVQKKCKSASQKKKYLQIIATPFRPWFIDSRM